MIDPAIVEQLLAAWNHDQSHPGRDRVQRQLPPPSVVKRFIEAAFYASLKTEEGRPLAFSAALVNESDMTDGTHRYLYRCSRFDRPIPFAASTIPKIAPAFDPTLSSLAVAPTQDKELICWGEFAHTPTAARNNLLTVGISSSMLSRPDCLTVSTTAPGALLFSRGGAVVGRFSSGFFIAATPTPFTVSSLGDYLYRMFERTESWRMYGPSYWHIAKDAIEMLLSEASRRGHGATIALLDSASTRPTVYIHSSMQTLRIGSTNWEGARQLGQLLNRCAETWTDQARYTEHLIVTRQALEELQRTAQLGSVDGALILDSSFDVLGFGATLIAPEWMGDTFMGPDGFGRSRSAERFDVTRYGKRHAAALNFAGACAESIVFVISQDGPVRAFTRTDGSTVLWWPDCDASMFT